MEGPRTGPGVRGAEGACHLVFLPDRAAPRFLVWGAGAGASPLSAGGTAEKACLVDETLAPRELAGVAVPLLDALPLLAAMTAAAQGFREAGLEYVSRRALALRPSRAREVRSGVDRIAAPPPPVARAHHHLEVQMRLAPMSVASRADGANHLAADETGVLRKPLTKP